MARKEDWPVFIGHRRDVEEEEVELSRSDMFLITAIKKGNLM